MDWQQQRRRLAASRRHARAAALGALALAVLASEAPLRPRRPGPAGCFAQAPAPGVRRPGRGGRPGRRGGLPRRSATAAQDREAQIKADADVLAFETAKFNLRWTQMKEAEEQNSPKLAVLKEDIDRQAEIIVKLGGSKPAEMVTLEEASRAAKIRSDLTFDKLMGMSNEERWIVAQGLGPAFPISLVLSYTLYWALNVPFIAYAYFTTVATGQSTMALVMAGAYATSIPFKPLVYIGAILGTAWTAETVLPLIARFFETFKPANIEKYFDSL